MPQSKSATVLTEDFVLSDALPKCPIPNAWKLHKIIGSGADGPIWLAEANSVGQLASVAERALRHDPGTMAMRVQPKILKVVCERQGRRLPEACKGLHCA